ncbi:stalk domain-containing protein [Ruminiclostridium josui]|uniref:stalk domain-containing protein n=1 Tax=Ruminiclostridium josui TaxID=1499 RepID=UPI000463E487|nr:stalk domain-containing protein [Ruminiclostridium josui]
MKKALLFFIIIAITLTLFPGVSSAAADSKTLAKVETAKIEKLDGICSIKIIYPVLSGFDSAKKINDLLNDENLDSIGYIRREQVYLEEYIKDMPQREQNLPLASIDSLYDYNTSGDILSLVTNTYVYTGGAHGTTTLEAYTMNTKTGEIYTFNSLFNPNSNYKKVIQDKIKKSIDKEKDLYFDDAKTTVDEANSNYKFYIDGNNLVIYFGLYELRPYAGGIAKFSIPAKELKGLLKDDVYNQMINAKALERIRLNGISIKNQFKTFDKDYVLMVPLKAAAEILGYKVGWDSKKGASIAGGYIKNNVGTYYTADSKKIKLTPAQIVENVMYVPITFFSEVLKEDVSYDGEAIRFFTKSTVAPSQFDLQSTEFMRADSAKECAELYAKAIEERKGVLQYGLMSPQLRAVKKTYFEELDWVTGVSSPWITTYNIKDNGDGTFKITFHWTTSAGKSPDTIVTLSISKVKDQDYFEITDIKE